MDFKLCNNQLVNSQGGKAVLSPAPTSRARRSPPAHGRRVKSELQCAHWGGLTNDQHHSSGLTGFHGTMYIYQTQTLHVYAIICLHWGGARGVNIRIYGSPMGRVWETQKRCDHDRHDRTIRSQVAKVPKQTCRRWETGSKPRSTGLTSQTGPNGRDFSASVDLPVFSKFRCMSLC